MQSTLTNHTTEHSLRVVPFHDNVVEANGYPIEHPYVEMFWLPILGPTATWLARRLASGLVGEPSGYSCDMADLARALGVSYTQGRHNPFARALQRCAMFGVAQQLAIEPVRTVAVRTSLPRLPHRHLDRLPDALRLAHEDWLATS